MRRPDAEIFRENVLRYKPMKMKLWELEESAGYAKGHLCSNVWKNCNVTVEHARNYARVLGVPPLALLEGMFNEN